MMLKGVGGFWGATSQLVGLTHQRLHATQNRVGFVDGHAWVDSRQVVPVSSR